MIDFRYHLVSLISVFLALAVGVVLGAGPLRESLGTQLAGQVEQLRTEKDAQREENARLSTQTDDLGSYITATAPTLVAGTLTQEGIAVITDDTSTRRSVESTAALIEDAGGTVPVRITLTTRLWDPAQAESRASAVSALRTAAPTLTLQGDDDIQRLGDAIGAILTASSSELPGGQRTAALEALSGAQMISVDGELSGPVDGVLYASAAPGVLAVASDDASTAATRAQSVLAAQTALILDLAERAAPTVVVGTAPEGKDATGILRIARSDARFARLSTVDGLERTDGPPVAVLALAEQLQGGAGSYGTGTDADARVPGDVSGAASDGGEG